MNNGMQHKLPGALLVLPILGVTLVIGIVVSILQAVTNIQEQTLVFIPKIIGVMVLLFFALPWMFQVLISLTLSFFDKMGNVIPQ